LIEDKVLMG